MTSFAAALPPREQRLIRTALRERIDEWLKLSYRHDVLTARAVRGLQLEATALFDREVVRPLLVQVGGRLSSVQLRTGDLVRDLFPELVSLRAEIEQTVHRGSDAIRRVTEQRMGEIARQEVRWVESAARKVLGGDFGAGVAGRFGDGVPAQAERSVRENTWLGDTTEKWFEKLLDRPTADKARAWVTTAVKQGLSVDEITRGLAGTKTMPGVLDSGRVAAKALVRTAATHATTVSRTDAFRELGVTHWRFLATLDQRTCFSADTPVRLANGEIRAISSLRAGDFVESGSGRPRRVNGVKRTTGRDWRVISFSNGDRVECTWNHPFWTIRGWVEATDLEVGSLVGERSNREAKDASRVHLCAVRGGIEPQKIEASDLLPENVLLRSDVGHLPEPGLRGVHETVQGPQGIRGSRTITRPPLLGRMPEEGQARWSAEFSDGVLLRGMQKGVHQNAAPHRQGIAEVVLKGVSEEAGDAILPNVQDFVRGSAGIGAAILLGGLLPEVEGGDATGGDGPRGDRDRRSGLLAGGQDRPVVDRLRDSVAVTGDRSGRLLLAREDEGPRRQESSGDRGQGALAVSDGGRLPNGLGEACGCAGTRPAPHGFVEVQSIERRIRDADCFDIEVDGDHCFLVGSGLIAHNSLVCASEDGNIYELGEGPVPPLHPGCRSVMTPAFGPDDEPSGKRASIKGQVPASTTFEEWVETIPKAEQDRYFGKAKATAWRAGKLTLKDMLGRDMQPLTLAELRELDRL